MPRGNTREINGYRTRCVQPRHRLYLFAARAWPRASRNHPLDVVLEDVLMGSIDIRLGGKNFGSADAPIAPREPEEQITGGLWREP